MKKTLFLILVFLVGAGSALAITQAFTDEANFPSWAKDSILKLQGQGVIEGYADGNFGPNQPVSRAELSVMFDRFEEKVVQSQIEEYVDSKWKEGADTEIQQYINYKLEDIVMNIEKFDDQDLDYKAYLVLAESGLKKREQGLDLSLMEKDENAILPEGYEAYIKKNIVQSIYLHYVGTRLVGGDVEVEVDEWYGPFGNY